MSPGTPQVPGLTRTKDSPMKLLSPLRLAIPLLLAVTLAACGAADAASNRPVATAPSPTPIPTTAPILLPAPDDTLPAVAPLPPAQVAVATELAPETEVFVAAVAPTATAERAAAVSSTARWSECLLAAADNTGTTALLDPIAASTPVDMTSLQLNALAATAVNCNVVESSLRDTDLGGHVGTAQACMNAWLESSGGGSVLVGLVSIGWAQATPAWAQQHLVGALSACFTGPSFAAEVTTVVAADPTLNGAFDATCLASSFDMVGPLRTFAQLLADNPSSATLSIELSDPWVLQCAHPGQMVAAAAAAEGVSLGSATVACIDAELINSGLVAQLLAGTADTDAVGVATIACLTNDEASALLG